MPRTSWPTETAIRAAQDGDVASLAAVISGSHPHVHRFASSLCASPQDAEDAAQEALIILYRKIGTLRASSALAAWMFRIVRNECLRRLGAALNKRSEPVCEPVAPSTDEVVLRRLEAERVAAAKIASMPAVSCGPTASEVAMNSTISPRSRWPIIAISGEVTTWPWSASRIRPHTGSGFGPETRSRRGPASSRRDTP